MTITSSSDSHLQTDAATASEALALAPSAAPPRPRRGDWEFLTMCCAAVLLSFLLQVRPDERVVVPGLSRFPLPQTCMSRQLFHVDCPGCGMTRSFIYLAHGNLAESWREHHLGWLIALLVLVQIPYRLACIYRERRPFVGMKVPKFLSWGLIVLLFVNWALKFIH